ncbi:MAG: DUF2442 domain-containing protein [bacterium]|nr:DUF2442 domain-containing protein [bacterium]
MMLSGGMVIGIKSAEYITDYKLRLCFNDGNERVVNFGPFLHKSLNPMVREYLNLDRFKKFTLEYGDLVWNDYDLCFPIADLYEGRI